MSKKLISTYLVYFITFSCLAAQSPEGDFIRSIGKIYVVVAVVAVIFLAIILYLIYLDRKISRLEKSIDNEFKTS